MNETDEAPGGRSERWQIPAICALLVLTGAVAWSYSLRSDPAVDTSPLASFPEAFGYWRGEPVPIDDEVTAMLNADFNLQLAYGRLADDHPLWLYVGYYGTARGGRPEHTPWVCYPSAGWEIAESRRVTLDAGRGLAVNEVRVERDGALRLVYFWYRSHRATGILSSRGQLLDRMLGRITDGRGDGALVRVSSPIGDPDDLDALRAEMRAFSVEVDVLLASHWPVEGEDASSGAAHASR